MTSLTPKSFKFKLKPGDWQHTTPCAGSLSIIRGALCRDSSFLLHNCKNQSQFEQRLMVKQESEWKWRKTKVTAIRLCRWDEHRNQVLGRCFMPVERLSGMPYSIRPWQGQRQPPDFLSFSINNLNTGYHWVTTAALAVWWSSAFLAFVLIYLLSYNLPGFVINSIRYKSASIVFHNLFF